MLQENVSLNENAGCEDIVRITTLLGDGKLLLPPTAFQVANAVYLGWNMSLSWYTGRR